jgi:hypothetical protein
VAAEFLFLAVARQRNAAIGAAGDVAAKGHCKSSGIAADSGTEWSARGVPANRAIFVELRREDRDHLAFAHGLAHVHESSRRHLFIIGALEQFQRAYLPLLQL